MCYRKPEADVYDGARLMGNWFWENWKPETFPFVIDLVSFFHRGFTELFKTSRLSLVFLILKVFSISFVSTVPSTSIPHAMVGDPPYGSTPRKQRSPRHSGAETPGAVTSPTFHGRRRPGCGGHAAVGRPRLTPDLGFSN